MKNKIHKLSDMWRGWFIGDFEPSIYKTKMFEVGLMSHKKDEDWPRHFHLVATEYNLLVSGKLKIGDQEYNQGDIWSVEPGETTKVEFLEDCQILVVKVPSVKNDKFVV